jgi:Bacterial SH3 domain
MNGCMRRLTLGALALLLTLQGAFAADLVIIKPWTTVRARPQASAPAVGLAFGNDTLALVRRSGDWLAVRLRGGRLGWIAAADAELATAAPATAAQPASEPPAAAQPVPAGAAGAAGAPVPVPATASVEGT